MAWIMFFAPTAQPPPKVLASPVCPVDLVSLWQPPKAQPCALLRAPLWNDGSTPSWAWHLLHRALSTTVRRAV